jgi:iron complex transport system substrate-binding protein
VNYRAPSLRTLFAIAAAALLVSALMTFSRPVEMLVDGEHIESDVSPVTADVGRVFVPLRAVADAVGAQTFLDPKDGRILVVRGGQSLRLTAGDVHAKINGVPLTFERAPFRVRGRVMIELAPVAGALGVRVRYDPRAARFDVLTSGIGQASVPSGATGQTQ